MEGSGCFTHGSNFELKGEYKANYYIQGDLMLNPFIEGDELQEEIHLQEESRKKNIKIMEAQQKQVKIHRILSPHDLLSTVQAINNSNRISFITSSSQSYLLKADIIRNLPNNLQEIDLRSIVSYRKSEGRDNAREFLRGICKDALTSGGCLLLNLDDSTVKYEELYYPDLQEFFHPTSFPAALFKPEMMKRDEVWSSFISPEDLALNQDYLFVI